MAKISKFIFLGPETSALWASLILPCTGELGEQGLGQCIADIYTWSLAIIGIAAFVQIIYAGFRYLTAFGNVAAAGQARSRIANAVLGIILLFSSYLILRTINPDLVGGRVILPKYGPGAPQDSQNSGGDKAGNSTDPIRIERFNVEPNAADLSDNTMLTFRVGIFGSKEGIEKLCGAGTAEVYYRVLYTEAASFQSDNPYFVLVRYHSWRTDEFGTGGKVWTGDFQQRLTEGYQGASLNIKPEGIIYQLEFRCGNGAKTKLKTSAPAMVYVTP